MAPRKYFSQFTLSRRVPAPIILTITLIALALILRLTLAWVSLKNLPATSDEASSVLLAKMIFHGQFPLLFIGQPYQFPVEAYLMAPFVEWLPRNAFGARYQAFILGLLSVVGFLLITRAGFAKGARWPAALLILFPSAYLLLFTSAYAPPQYSMALTLSWISIYLVLRFRQTENMILLLFSGLTSGLAFSNHMLTVMIGIGVFAILLFGGNIRRDLKGALVFGAGALLGALPYILAIWLKPGAYGMLPLTNSLKFALVRLMTVLTETYAGAMGVNPILYPDLGARLDWSHNWQVAFAAGYALVVVFLIIQRSWLFCKTVTARTWPTLSLVDLALISSILTLGSFAYHNVAFTYYRYVLPAVWCFPFLIGHVFASCRGRWKTLIGIIVIVLTIFNIKTSVSVIKKWKKPGLIQEYSDTPPLHSLMKMLEAKNITRCYATFWLAYRITFESDERILCALPYNERYPYWPIPYKKEVDDAPDAAYILSMSHCSFLNALNFQMHLRDQGISAVIDQVGPFSIYSEFARPASRGERVLNSDEYSLRESIHSGRFRPPGVGDTDSSRISPENRGESQWLEVTFAAPHIVTNIALFNLPVPLNINQTVRIFALENTGGNEAWRVLSDEANLSFERLKFRNNHPVYDEFSEQIRFNPVHAGALMVELQQPYKITAHFGFPKLEIYVRDPEKY
jgi:hypothetical protein